MAIMQRIITRIFLQLQILLDIFAGGFHQTSTVYSQIQMMPFVQRTHSPCVTYDAGTYQWTNRWIEQRYLIGKCGRVNGKKGKTSTATLQSGWEELGNQWMIVVKGKTLWPNYQRCSYNLLEDVGAEEDEERC